MRLLLKNIILANPVIKIDSAVIKSLELLKREILKLCRNFIGL
jgi:hypothetical protein